MPDTFSRGKGKRKRKKIIKNANVRGQTRTEACGAGGGGDGGGGGGPCALIKVTRHQQLEHHTRLYHPTHCSYVSQRTGDELQLDHTLTHTHNTIITASVTNSDQL